MTFFRGNDWPVTVRLCSGSRIGQPRRVYGRDPAARRAGHLLSRAASRRPLGGPASPLLPDSGLSRFLLGAPFVRLRAGSSPLPRQSRGAQSTQQTAPHRGLLDSTTESDGQKFHAWYACQQWESRTLRQARDRRRAPSNMPDVHSSTLGGCTRARGGVTR